MKLLLLLVATATLAHAHEVPVKVATPIQVSGGVMAARVVTRIYPVYPPIGPGDHISGAILLRATISSEGRVESLAWICGPQLFRQAALDAVSRWTYRPYLLHGEPVEVETTITINHSMEAPRPPAE